MYYGCTMIVALTTFNLELYGDLKWNEVPRTPMKWAAAAAAKDCSS